MSDKTIRLSVNFDDLADELADNLGRTNAVDFVMQLDAKFGEVDFTEELIKRLFNSLKGDLTAEQLQTLLSELGAAL